MSQNILPSNTQALLIQSLGDLEEMVLTREHPSLDRFSRRTMGGKGLKQPVVTGYGGGVGGDFEISLANAKVNVVNAGDFEIDPAVIYGHELIDWTSAEYTKDKDASALDIATLATEAAAYNATDNFASMIFGDGSGVMARIGSAVNTAGNIWRLVLESDTDSGKFQQDFVIVQKTTPFAATINTGEGTVLGTNPMNGSILIDVGASGLTPTAGRYIGLKGQVLASTEVVTFPGIFGYIPKFSDRTNGVPNVTTFLGMPRGEDSMVVAAAGWAFDGFGQPITVTANKAGGFMKNWKNAKPTELYLNGEDLPRVADEFQVQVRNDMPSKRMKGEMFYDGFRINIASGPVDVLAESACPRGYGVLTRSDQWVIGSPGKMFGPASPNGVMVQDYDTNKARFSVKCSGFFTTPNPVATAILTL
jgi:hypothetical protein